MGFWERVKSFFTPRSDRGQRWVYARCERCGEVLRTRVNLYNDLSVVYGDRKGEDSYFCRKVLMGDSGCFQRVELEMTFDSGRNLVQVDVEGGKYLTPEEVAALEE